MARLAQSSHEIFSQCDYNLMVAEKSIPCVKKLRLSEAVVKAVDALYHAKGSDAKAIARAAERSAVKALEAHRKEHGC